MIQTNAIDFDKITKQDAERFRQYVEPADDGSGCLLWTGFRNPKGYGQFNIGPRCVKAH